MMKRGGETTDMESIARRQRRFSQINTIVSNRREPIPFTGLDDEGKPRYYGNNEAESYLSAP
ncbi:MAG: hypothetical protein KAU17_07245 [Spirochaetales bacterium]|nr:hypothetical protein [Spirochaetales bacterium]